MFVTHQAFKDGMDFYYAERNQVRHSTRYPWWLVMMVATSTPVFVAMVPEVGAILIVISIGAVAYHSQGLDYFVSTPPPPSFATGHPFCGVFGECDSLQSEAFQEAGGAR